MESSITATTIYYDCYKGEEELENMLMLIEKDLSEPYSIYTYRFFLHEWPQLTFNCKLIESNLIVGTIIAKIQNHKEKKSSTNSNTLRGYIGMLAVNPHYRRQGIARKLLEKLIHEFRMMKVEEIVLETEITNQAALSFYENFGFFRDKYLLRYYFNGSDAYRLKFKL